MAPSAFSPMRGRGRVIERVESRDISAAPITIKTTSEGARLAESIVFYEQELLAAKIRTIGPGPVAMRTVSPSIVINLKTLAPGGFIKNAMIDHAVNLATRHDKRIGIQPIKMAVVDSRRWTGSHKMHASIVSDCCGRSISKREACQPKRLRRLECRYNNSRHTTCLGLGDGCRVRFESRTRLAAHKCCAGAKKTYALLR